MLNICESECFSYAPPHNMVVRAWPAPMRQRTLTLIAKPDISVYSSSLSRLSASILRSCIAFRPVWT